MQRYARHLPEGEGGSASHSELLWAGKPEPESRACAHLQHVGWFGAVKQLHISIFLNLANESILSFLAIWTC